MKSNNVSIKLIEQRLVVIMSFTTILFLLLFGRVVYLQAFESGKLNQYGKNQRLVKLTLHPERGRILDRNGSELAQSASLRTIWANPYQISDPAKTASKLAKILKLDKTELELKLRKRSGFVYLARKISPAKAQKVAWLKIEGIGFDSEYKRLYPEGSLAAQVIGFTDIDSNGLAGIEAGFNSYLAGKAGYREFEKDAAGNIIPYGKYVNKPPKNGENIMLTIDKAIQFKAEEALAASVKKFNAKSGMALVMNVKTGEVLAMANVPQFDPNLPKTSPGWVYKNRTISDIFEPGSTMKSLIASGALEDKVVSFDQSFYLKPTYKIGNKTIKEAHRNTAKNFTFKQIIAESSNIGMITMGVKMGRHSIYNWIRKFGLTGKIGVKLPGESSGYVEQPSNWSATTIGNVPIGQGVTTNALQLLRAVSAIANDGIMVKPKVIYDKDPVKKERVISKETAAMMREAMSTVVTEGTGGSAKIDGYDVAGKTGTAQKVKEGARGYEKGKYIASFIGFTPLKEPEIGIIVVMDEPKPIWGGVVAAPVFKEIASFTLPYLGIRPDSANLR